MTTTTRARTARSRREPWPKPPALNRHAFRVIVTEFAYKMVATLAAVFAVFGGLPLITSHGSGGAQLVAGLVLPAAAVELVWPGVLSRGKLPLRWSLFLAAPPIGLTLAAVLATIATHPATHAAALDTLRGSAVMAAVFSALYALWAVYWNITAGMATSRTAR